MGEKELPDVRREKHRVRLPELQPAGVADSYGERGAGDDARSAPTGRGGTRPGDGVADHAGPEPPLERRCRSNLSGGEKQRVAIARALANNPDLILADEPTANLDSARGREVMFLLRQIAFEMGKAVVIVSHDHRIREIANRIVWLEDGTFQLGRETERDPVCGRTIEVRGAPSYAHAALTYRFCGDQCLALFEEIPDTVRANGARSRLSMKKAAK